MANIKIEINEKYREPLDLLKQIIPNSKGEQITSDPEMIEALIDSFMTFVQEQAGEGDCKDGNCCGDSCETH